MNLLSQRRRRKEWQLQRQVFRCIRSFSLHVSLLSLVVISFVLFHAIDGSSSSIMTGMMGKGLSSLIPTSLTHEIRRILSSRCETVPYISPNDAAHYMPPISKFMNNEQPVEPSHVTLCRELVRRNKIALSINQDDADEWSKL